MLWAAGFSWDPERLMARDAHGGGNVYDLGHALELAARDLREG